MKWIGSWLVFLVWGLFAQAQTESPTVVFFSVMGPDGVITEASTDFEVSVFDEYFGVYVDVKTYPASDLYQFSFVHPGFSPVHPYCISVEGSDAAMEIHLQTMFEDWRQASLLFKFVPGSYTWDLGTLDPDQRTLAPLRAQDHWIQEED